MKALFRSLFPLLVILLAAAMAWGQAETGEIAGTVTDPSGAVLPGATVTLRSLDKQFTRSTTTTSAGLYTFTSLQPGNYEVDATAAGFSPFKRQVAVTVGGHQTVDAKLAVQGSGTTVEVTAEGGAQVNTTTQTLSSVVSGNQVTQLPTLTRNPYDLVATTGNVSEGDTNNETQRGVGVTINGQRSASTDVLLDGGENVDEFDATVGQSVPLDSVQEFRVVTSDFTAEYGRASGGVVNVATKSGTNDFHGTVYEFNRISALAANTFENNAQGLPKSRFVRNQYGFSVGGPIVKDKLFFFVNPEWTKVRSSAFESNWVPSPQLIAASAPATQAFFSSFGALRTQPTGQVFTNSQLAAEAGAGVASLPGNFPLFDLVQYSVPADSGGGNPQNDLSGVARLDYTMSDRTSMFLRYGVERGTLFAGTVAFSPFAGYDTGQITHNHNILLSLTHLFSNNFVSQSKVVFNRLNLLQPLGTAGVTPGAYLQATTVTSLGGNNVALPGYLPFSPGNAIPFGGPQNLYQLYEDMNWTHGNHQVRFGGLFIHTRDNRDFGAFENAVEDFSLDSPAAGINGMLAGQLFDLQTAVFPQGKFPCVTNPATGLPNITPDCTLTLPATQPRFSRNNRYNDGAAYVQDTWKIFPRLTLNAGVRWEYYGVQHNVDPRLDSNFYYGAGSTIFDRIRNGNVQIAPNSPVGGLWNPDWNNFGPRIGFAWDVFGNGKTSFRGGYGISYERDFGNVTFNVIQNPPNYAVLDVQNGVDVPTLPVTTNNLGPLGGSTGSVPLPRTSLRWVDQNITTAYAETWSAALEQEIAPNTVFGLEYSGSHGVNLYTISNPNRPGSGVAYLGDNPAVVGLDRLNFQYSSLNRRANGGFSRYNALNVKLQSSDFMKTGLQLTANYTFAHAIDNLSTTFSESFNNFNLGLLDPFRPKLDEGNADFDIRHRFVLSAVWATPWLKHDKGFAGQLLGGWSIAPIFNIASGTPFTTWDCSMGAAVCVRYTPVNGAAVPVQGNTSNPNSTGGINDFVYLRLPDANSFSSPLLGISDFGACTTPGEAATPAGCPFPADMTGRNHFRGPGRWNLDTGVYKTFNLTERVQLQLRGEAFNIFNHHNWYLLGEDAAIFAPNTAPLIDMKKGGRGLPFVDERRNLQLGAKIVF